MFYQTNSPQNPTPAIKYVYQHGVEEPEHQHQVIQLLHIVKGVIRVYTQDRCWVIPPDHALLIPAGVPQSLSAVGTVDGSSLYLDFLARADLTNEMGIFQVNPLLKELINTASDFEESVESGSREDRINELILDELRLLNFNHFNVPMPLSNDLREFCEKIAQSLARPWELADVAQYLNVSARTISRRFQAETGMSFGEWLRRYRLLKSMELMASGFSVTDAALAVGYESQSWFSVTFKRRVGISPNAYVSSSSKKVYD